MGKTRAKKNAKKLADAMEVSSGGATHLPGASAAFVAAATASRSKGEKINGKVDGDAESILGIRKVTRKMKIRKLKKLERGENLVDRAAAKQVRDANKLDRRLKAKALW